MAGGHGRAGPDTRRPHSPRLAPAGRAPARGGADCYPRPVPSPPAGRGGGASRAVLAPFLVGFPPTLTGDFRVGTLPGSPPPQSRCSTFPLEREVVARFSPEVGVPDTGRGVEPWRTGRALPQRFTSSEPTARSQGPRYRPGALGSSFQVLARQLKPGNQTRGTRLGRGGQAGR